MSDFDKLLCRPWLMFLAGYLAGVYGAVRCGPAATVLSGVLCFVAGILMLIATGSIRFSNGRRLIFYLSVWGCVPLFIAAGYYRTQEVQIKSPLKLSLSRAADGVAAGTVSDVALTKDGALITISDPTVTFNGNTFRSNKIHIYTDNRYPDRELIGCVLTADGRLYPYEAATNPGQFDSDAYYSARNIDARLYAKEINIYPDDERNPAAKAWFFCMNRLCTFRMRMCDGIYHILPQKEAGVLCAMLLGERGLMDTELKALYSDGGIAHILSISALHVTLLGMGLFRLLTWLIRNRKLSCILTIVIIFVYGILTGFSVSTQRAVIMLCANMLSRLIFRAYDDLSACALSAVVILLIQPLYLFDSGFQMSYMAVSGIISMKWLIERYGIKNPVVCAFIPCVSVFVFTLPVIMNTYYEVPVYSILINPVILVFMSMLLVSGFSAGVLASVWGAGAYSSAALGSVSSFLAGPVYFILKMYEKLCELEKELPFSKAVTGAPGSAVTVIYYAALCAGLYVLIKMKMKRGALLLLLCLAVFVHPKEPLTRIYYLDVGQGDCAYIETGGYRILCDGGSSSVTNAGRYRIEPFLKHKGVIRLDAVMLSHMDADHVNGVEELIERGYPQIGMIIVPCTADQEHKVLKLAEEKGIKVMSVKAGDEPVAGCDIRIVAPDTDKSYKDANEGSAVTCLECMEFSALFTGDSGFESESVYAAKVDGTHISVLKTAHHGSRYSTSKELLEAVKPAVAVISCSKYNSYGHPSPQTVERLNDAGAYVLTTPESGMVSVSYNGGSQFSVRRYKDD